MEPLGEQRIIRRRDTQGLRGLDQALEIWRCRDTTVPAAQLLTVSESDAAPCRDHAVPNDQNDSASDVIRKHGKQRPKQFGLAARRIKGAQVFDRDSANRIFRLRTELVHQGLDFSQGQDLLGIGR